MTRWTIQIKVTFSLHTDLFIFDLLPDVEEMRGQFILTLEATSLVQKGNWHIMRWITAKSN